MYKFIPYWLSKYGRIRKKERTDHFEGKGINFETRFLPRLVVACETDIGNSNVLAVL